jgi:hypothetical protein
MIISLKGKIRHIVRKYPEHYDEGKRKDKKNYITTEN